MNKRFKNKRKKNCFKNFETINSRIFIPNFYLLCWNLKKKNDIISLKCNKNFLLIMKNYNFIKNMRKFGEKIFRLQKVKWKVMENNLRIKNQNKKCYGRNILKRKNKVILLKIKVTIIRKVKLNKISNNFYNKIYKQKIVISIRILVIKI